jgi:hypothetical protein
MRGIRVVVGIVVTAVVLNGCAMHSPARPQAEADDHAGAVGANFFYAPGRAITCGTAGFISGVIMLLTFGHAYDGASEMMHGACSGPWTVTGQDIRDPVR